MRIIHSVAALAARLPPASPRRRRVMTTTAIEIFVPTVQGEAGPAVVVETPELPTVRVVAGPASTTEAALVDIVVCMAGIARMRRVLEHHRLVAFLARYDSVQAEKRETRQLVIESHLGRPARRIVARPAALALLFSMDVVRQMAAVTIAGKLFLAQHSTMAAAACHIVVRAGEGELRITLMIKASHEPISSGVTILASLSISSPMLVVCTVASDAARVECRIRRPRGTRTGSILRPRTRS